MRFTRLRLNGFKSFVDATDLVIRDGLTGVVGPNGCGKSNLLEALRWVMGENRPTAMRGTGMEDVVFAGTGTRNARAFAEVVLFLDNSDRRAPAGFNDSDMLEVTRRLTRDAGSSYRLNGKEVRARDVQMLFADASTGAHSPALVRQGQIAELINARPRARRRVLEEAAGISGLYQRRHEAELRLSATETNLSRVGDTIDTLAQQLATLARQARQAARYREIGADLRRAEGMLLCRRLHEAETQATAHRAALDQAATAAARAEREARAAVAAREAAEAALPPLREEEAIAGAVLQRLLVERETLDAEETRARRMVQELTERIEQLRNDAAREASLASDADDSIARLAAERAALNDASAGQEARQARADAAAEAARTTLTGREAELATATEALAQLSAREQALAQHASDAKTQQNRAAEAERRARADAAREQARMDAALDAQAKAEAALAAAQERLAQAENAANDSETALAQAQQAEATARLQRAEADSTASTLAAEARALERMLEKNPLTGTAVLGKVRVAPGLEPALGAALGDGLQAPLMDAGHAQGSGWHELTPLDPAPALPAGAEPLSQHVQAPAALSRRLSQVGVAPADQAPAMQAALLPGQRLVTRAGDLWRWDGLVRLSADHAGNAAVLRLQQANRLQAIQADLAQAQTAATQITARHEASRQALARATAADKAARDTRRQSEAALSDLRRALSRAEAEAAQAATRGSAARALAERHAAETLAAAQQVAETEQALAALDDLSNARTRLQTLRAQVDAARADVLVQRSAQEELRRDSAARARRIAEIARDMEGWQGRKAQAGARVSELESRATETEAALQNVAADPGTLTRRRLALAAQIEQAEARRTAAIEALAAGDQALRTAQESERDTERTAGTAREVRAAAQVHADAAADTLRQAGDQIAEAHDCTPAQLQRQLGITTESLPPLAALETDIARLRRARDALGAVNLRADEDAGAVSTEHDTLIAERADLEAAVAKLRGGISALNREGRERLLAAFERVNENFATLFTHLFGGGEARLVLVESDDPLEAGLEIMCQPPGKKLSTLSLLSGGEQTLTALALIFGVFLANPAPICVLDEVDAPLDDANVARFCDLLDEMTRRTETRFMVITHNAITMARMDRLFGVTMAEQGVSQLVSVDLQRAEALVA